jgi:hypothetical protein
MKPTLMLLLSLLFAVTAVAQPVATAICEITIQLPPGWAARPDPYEEDAPCSICLIPSNWRDQWNDAEIHDLGECAFLLTAVRGDLETAAPETYFEKHEGRWFVAGRMGALSETESIVVGDWVGIQGYTLVRKPNKLGGMAPGLGEAYRLFVANPCGWSVLLEGDDAADPEFLKVLFAAIN